MVVKYLKRVLENYQMLIVSMVCVLGVVFFTEMQAWALQPATPENIESLKQRGQLQNSLENALKIGNHKTRSKLVEKFKVKAERLYFKSVGLTLPDMQIMSATLPPGRQGGLPSTGSPKIFALLIDFNDEAHVNDALDIDDMLFGDGDPNNTPRESLTSYYDRASYGLLDLSGGTTLGWYTTSYDRTTVTQDSTGREDLIKEALKHFDDNGHDFSQYDNDSDGDIEYFIVLWAGPNGDWATFWWAWNLGWNDGSYTIDGKTLSNYSWQRESNNPTVVVHETGHSLGLPDLYDYDNLVGPGAGVGGFDPMDSNVADPNCFWKWMLDWATPTVVPGGRQDIELDDLTSTDQCVLVWPGVNLTDIFGEFYIVENRQAVGNDEDLWFTPDGLAIWHIDATLDAGGTNFEYNNSTTDHKLIRLMEADGLEEIESYACCKGCSCQVADAADLYTNGDDFGPDTVPSSDKYDTSDSCVRVYKIDDLGATVGDNIVSSFSTECNTIPVCDADGPYHAECQGTTTDIIVDGSGSYDVDEGDLLSYFWWSETCGTDTLNAVSGVMTIDSSPGCNVECEASLTVTDTHEDDDSCSSSVTIVDSLPPDVSCPSNLILECDMSTAPEDTGIASVTDICDPAQITADYVDTITQGSCPQEYTIARNWGASDECGNEGDCIQSIEIEDTTPPDIYCNASDITPSDAPTAFTATAVDNCDGEALVEIIGYDCVFYTKKGKAIDKEESCIINVIGDTLLVHDSGGIDNSISWTVQATDCVGNRQVKVCSIDVVKK